MTYSSYLSCVVLALGVILPKTALSQTNPTPEELVRQLGDRSFQVREQATKRLIALGRASVPALEAGSRSVDSEIWRARKTSNRRAGSDFENWPATARRRDCYLSKFTEKQEIFGSCWKPTKRPRASNFPNNAKPFESVGTYHWRTKFHSRFPKFWRRFYWRLMPV